MDASLIVSLALMLVSVFIVVVNYNEIIMLIKEFFGGGR